MVRPERFELPTLWFEAKCSIQLSYGRANTYNTNTQWANRGYVAVTGSAGGSVTNIGIFSTTSNPARRRS
jgi:hypothetical protein